jgi:FkbM family methyltransferase
VPHDTQTETAAGRFAAGDLAGAEAALVSVLGRDPLDLEARHDLAVVLHAAGRAREAVSHAQAVVDADAAWPGALATLGACQLAAMLPQAEATLCRAVIAAADPVAVSHLASLRAQRGDIIGAYTLISDLLASVDDRALEAVAANLEVVLRARGFQLAEKAGAPQAAGSAVVIVAPRRDGIAATIASLAAQTQAPAEIVVVDDASDDDARGCAERAADAYGAAVRVVTLARAQGPSGARAAGVAATTAPFLLVVDAGETLTPDAVATLQAGLAQARDASVCYAASVSIGADDPLAPPTAWSYDALTTTPANPRPALVRRAALVGVGGYRTDAVGLADAELVLRLFAAGHRAVCAPRYLLRRNTTAIGGVCDDAATQLAWPRLIVALGGLFGPQRAQRAQAALDAAGRARVAPWFGDRGDETLRLDYPLTAASVVIDAGGYEGQWSADIVGRYGCTVYCYEPLTEFADAISRRFADEPRVHVYAAGLAAESRMDVIHVAADATSVFGAGRPVEIRLIGVADAFRELAVDRVDLLKINIEGGEYELCEQLIATGLIERVVDLQVQFHDFVPAAQRRRDRIRRALAATHTVQYDYPFTWEGWRRKP